MHRGKKIAAVEGETNVSEVLRGGKKEV